MRLTLCVMFLGACAPEDDSNIVVSAPGETDDSGEVATTELAFEAWMAFASSSFVSVTPTETDADGDGYNADVDCDDGDPRENPDPTNIDYANDTLDQDCSGSEALAAFPNTQFVFNGDSWASVVVRCGSATLIVPLDENGYGILYNSDPEHCATFTVNLATDAPGYTHPVLNANPDELGINDEDPVGLYLWTLPGDAGNDLGYGIAEPIPSDPCGSYWEGDAVTWSDGWTYGYPAYCD